MIKGREYARRYREQTIPIIGKYTQRKREFNEFDYDSTVPVLTPEGWVSDEILKEDVAMRAELVGVAGAGRLRQVFRLQHRQENLPRSEKLGMETGAVADAVEEHR